MLAMQAAVAAVEDVEYFETTCQKIIASREWTVAALQQLGFEVIPSAANFIFASHPGHDAAKIFAALREKKILVRYFNKPRINQHLRITIGTQQECEALLTALQEIVI